MDAGIQDILKKAAAYVAETQPAIDKAAAARDAFVKRAQTTVHALVEKGIVAQSKETALFDKIAADPASVFDLVEKMADLVGADTMGAPSETTAKDASTDPFVSEYKAEIAAITNRSTLL